ncbi:hypothetical protein C7974DRAFT_404609 [Boeremia exigua]|uniref:uncharacterized protein n=1 Tax=Boeremia exigua TaxID=749465 RepID=UPI001E8CAF97|nr:uncharacterized protein C7974DRAFT_404609 [Boeremia exigua]KAH6614154.1 hypothetical protein C7974DRAFT_404609 [Boeremia exigua]
MYIMSSPATQYVYIPNLVGRQMLRVPVEDIEAENIITFSSPVSQASNETMEDGPSRLRDSTRSASISSASSVEETE